MKFGIIGNGFVGGATQVLECDANEMVVQDIVPEKCVPPGLTLHDLKECDFLFIAVPTPMKVGGECDLSIVNSVVNNLREVDLDFNRTHVIIRSTVLPGTTDTYGVQFMPEFLTEKNYIQDFINCSHWVLGAGKDELDAEFIAHFQELINNAHRAGKIKHNTVIPLLNREAELVKYTRNSYLALKVSYFNEIYQVANALNINYDQFIRGVVCDERIGASHTAVPGHDGHFGQGGTCFPKDTNALRQFQARTVGVDPPILSAAIHRNETMDRPEQDWKQDRRAFTPGN